MATFHSEAVVENGEKYFVFDHDRCRTENKQHKNRQLFIVNGAYDVALQSHNSRVKRTECRL